MTPMTITEVAFPGELTEEIVPILLDELLAEIEHYLAAVDTFRSEGYSPHWKES